MTRVYETGSRRKRFNLPMAAGLTGEIKMVTLNIIMNTSMEDILAFKCCALPNQNLEVHVVNGSEKPVMMKSCFYLKNDAETLKVENIYPPIHQTIGPKDIAAFYCSMDESQWEKFHTLQMEDAEGNVYQKAISHNKG